MGNTQKSINGWLDKQIMVDIYKQILFCHKKEQSIETCYNMDEPQKCYFKWNKPEMKAYILYSSFYMTHPEQAHPLKQKADWTFPGVMGRRGEEWFLKTGHTCLLRWWKSFETRESWWLHNIVTTKSTELTEYFKIVNCMLCGFLPQF